VQSRLFEVTLRTVASFRKQTYVLERLLQVAIEGINVAPEAGLYNGARRMEMDIVYDSVAGPNSQMKTTSRYVLLSVFLVLDWDMQSLGTKITIR